MAKLYSLFQRQACTDPILDAVRLEAQTLLCSIEASYEQLEPRHQKQLTILQHTLAESKANFEAEPSEAAS